MKEIKILGLPLPLYLVVLALTVACMAAGCIPNSLVPAFLVLMVFGEGLNTIGKTVLAGIGFPLFIEITQLPFYDRCSDIDDIILNTTGILISAVIYFGVKRLKNCNKK